MEKMSVEEVFYTISDIRKLLKELQNSGVEISFNKEYVSFAYEEVAVELYYSGYED